jgi:Cro/C1-type HTH DNA-binding domain
VPGLADRVTAVIPGLGLFAACPEEQLYRLVARTPERLSLATLATLCDILRCASADLIEPVITAGAGPRAGSAQPGPLSRPGQLRRRSSRKCHVLQAEPKSVLSQSAH